MKNIIIPILIITLGVLACKKDKTLCLESTVTLDYHTLNQYDSTYTNDKICMEESKWETAQFAEDFDPVTGQVIKQSNKEGTSVVTYYNSVRGDSVTRTTVTTSVPE